MKKLLSLLLALSMLLSLAGCGVFAIKDISVDATTQTTEPLYWPPLPSETEETTVPEESIQPSEQTRPMLTDPEPEPTDKDIEATYYPREDEETRPREDDNNHPVYTEPEETEAATEATTEPQTEPPTTEPTEPSRTLDPNGTYDSKEDVALFIHLYGRLPNNYITKSQARALGWKSGSLERYAPGKCIGGDRFYNNEGLLPKGHTYYECDIDTLGSGSRGAKRIVFSTDGLVYYTSNHYSSFTLLYGEP